MVHKIYLHSHYCEPLPLSAKGVNLAYYKYLQLVHPPFGFEPSYIMPVMANRWFSLSTIC